MGLGRGTCIIPDAAKPKVLCGAETVMPGEGDLALARYRCRSSCTCTGMVAGMLRARWGVLMACDLYRVSGGSTKQAHCTVTAD